jgi:hypothetical protein
VLRASDATGIGIDDDDDDNNNDNNNNDNNNDDDGNDMAPIKRAYVKVQRQRRLPYNQTF